MKIESIIVILVLISIFLSGCVQEEKEDVKQKAIDACINLCKETSAVIGFPGLENGPCLSDFSDKWGIDDWVCDVAHDPRQDVDNLPENQCQEYREERAHHFVEVNPKCELIRAV